MVHESEFILPYLSGYYFIRNVKNTILAGLGLLRCRTITFALSDRCNLRCLMCDIWEKTDNKELNIYDIEKILSCAHSKHVKYIALTGGEPFQRDSLADIYERIRYLKKNALITISTNATLTGRMVDFLKRIRSTKQLCFELSLLGIKSHEFITRTEGSLERFRRSVSVLQDEFSGLALRAKFVITPWNYQEIEDVADYCRSRNLPLLVKLIENAQSYTNSLRYKENFLLGKFDFSAREKEAIEKSLEKIRNKTADPVMTQQVIYSLRGRRPNSRCFVRQGSLFITSDAKIYCCRNLEPIGDISQNESQGISGFSGKRFYPVNRCQECSSFLRFVI